MGIMRNLKKSIVRVSPQLHRIWTEAAEQEEISRAAFLRLSLRERARRILGDCTRKEEQQYREKRDE